ncbi:MAG: cyd operon YbgE family protein [Alphaproteobacteria bacterium]
MRSDRLRKAGPETPSRVPRLVSALLVIASAITVFAYPEIVDRPLGLPEKLNAAIIGLGALAGVIHMLGIVPQQRQLRAFAGPAVAWPVMAAGIVSLITS